MLIIHYTNTCIDSPAIVSLGAHVSEISINTNIFFQDNVFYSGLHVLKSLLHLSVVFIFADGCMVHLRYRGRFSAEWSVLARRRVPSIRLCQDVCIEFVQCQAIHYRPSEQTCTFHSGGNYTQLRHTWGSQFYEKYYDCPQKEDSLSQKEPLRKSRGKSLRENDQTVTSAEAQEEEGDQRTNTHSPIHESDYVRFERMDKSDTANVSGKTFPRRPMFMKQQKVNRNGGIGAHHMRITQRQISNKPAKNRPGANRKGVVRNRPLGRYGNRINHEHDGKDFRYKQRSGNKDDELELSHPAKHLPTRDGSITRGVNNKMTVTEVTYERETVGSGDVSDFDDNAYGARLTNKNELAKEEIGNKRVIHKLPKDGKTVIDTRQVSYQQSQYVNSRNDDGVNGATESIPKSTVSKGVKKSSYIHSRNQNGVNWATKATFKDSKNEPNMDSLTKTTMKGFKALGNMGSWTRPNQNSSTGKDKVDKELVPSPKHFGGKGRMNKKSEPTSHDFGHIDKVNIKSGSTLKDSEATNEITKEPIHKEAGSDDNMNKLSEPNYRDFGGNDNINMKSAPSPKDLHSYNGMNQQSEPTPKDFGGNDKIDEKSELTQKDYGSYNMDKKPELTYKKDGMVKISEPRPKDFGGRVEMNRNAKPTPQDLVGKVKMNKKSAPTHKDLDSRDKINENSMSIPKGVGGKSDKIGQESKPNHADFSGKDNIKQMSELTRKEFVDRDQIEQKPEPIETDREGKKEGDEKREPNLKHSIGKKKEGEVSERTSQISSDTKKEITLTEPAPKGLVKSTKMDIVTERTSNSIARPEETLISIEYSNTKETTTTITINPDTVNTLEIVETSHQPMQVAGYLDHEAQMPGIAKNQGTVKEKGHRKEKNAEIVALTSHIVNSDNNVDPRIITTNAHVNAVKKTDTGMVTKVHGEMKDINNHSRNHDSKELNVTLDRTKRRQYPEIQVQDSRHEKGTVRRINPRKITNTLVQSKLNITDRVENPANNQLTPANSERNDIKSPNNTVRNLDENTNGYFENIPKSETGIRNGGAKKSDEYHSTGTSSALTATEISSMDTEVTSPATSSAVALATSTEYPSFKATKLRCMALFPNRKMQGGRYMKAINAEECWQHCTTEPECKGAIWDASVSKITVLTHRRLSARKT